MPPEALAGCLGIFREFTTPCSTLRSMVVGVIILLKHSTPAKWIVFPLGYALLLFVTLLQQSLSVHLQGYSYIFSLLFAVGMVGLMVYFSQFIRSSVISIEVDPKSKTNLMRV